MRTKIFLFPFVLLSFLPSCSPIKEERVLYTSFAPIAEFAEDIAGSHYEVKCLTPKGGEPHDYEITPRQLQGVESSTLLFVNGLGIESYLPSLPESIFKKTVVLSDGIKTRKVDGVEDPHIWLSPRLAYQECETIARKLIEVDPDNKTDYESNLASLKTKFDTLDTSYQEATATFTQKYVLVAHAAFGYLFDDYGLTQLYVSGLSPEAEPSAKQLQTLLEEVKKYSLTTIFYEENVSGDVSKKIAEATDLKTETLATMESEEGDGKTYFDKSRENLEKLKEACR